MQRQNMTTYLKYNKQDILCFACKLLCIIIGIGLILAIVVILHYCANINPEVEEDNSWYAYLWKFILNNAPVIGVLSGFVGIIAGFLAFRPKFDISDTLIWTNTNRLKVAVRNKFFFFKLTDVSIEMDFIRSERDGRDIRTRKIEMNKDNVSVLYGRLAGKGKSNTYLFHSANGFVWNDKYTKIRCRVTAVHHISGIKRIKEEVFEFDQLKRGILQDGKFISQVEMYTLPGQDTWIPEIGRMLNKLQTVCEEMSYAIIPMGLSDKTKMMERIDKALLTVASLESKELQTMFPCLKDNADTIAYLTTQLVELQSFYKTKKNLNPGNKEKRNKLIDDISKYIVFLGDQMEKDVNDMYKELYKIELEKNQ